MTNNQRFIISFSFIALVAFFVLVAFLKSIQSPLPQSLDFTNAPSEQFSSEKDLFVTPGKAGETPPVMPTDPVLGSEDAKVTIQVFADFQCPFCAETHQTLVQIQKEHPKDVRIVWKDFPLPNHSQAKEIAFAARCAAHQGKFWEYAQQVFNASMQQYTNAPGEENQKSKIKNQNVGVAPQQPFPLDDIARQVGLNLTLFQQCVEQNTYAQEVGDSITQGLQADIDGVPYLFVNDERISGQPTKASLEALVQAELRK